MRWRADCETRRESCAEGKKENSGVSSEGHNRRVNWLCDLIAVAELTPCCGGAGREHPLPPPPHTFWSGPARTGRPPISQLGPARSGKASPSRNEIHPRAPQKGKGWGRGKEGGWGRGGRGDGRGAPLATFDAAYSREERGQAFALTTAQSCPAWPAALRWEISMTTD